MRSARWAAEAKAARTRSMSTSVTSRGVCQPSPNGIGEAAIVGQGSASGFNGPAPSHGRCAEPLRPEWAIWIPNLALPMRRACAITRAKAASLSSEYIPRAMGDTAMPFDMSCLHNHQGGTGMSQHPEVHEMPIIGAAVVSGILAHRRNHDAIGKLQARQAKRREQGTRHEVGFDAG